MTSPAPTREQHPAEMENALEYLRDRREQLKNYLAEIDEVLSLREENVRLKEALRFYADVGNILFMEKYGFLEYGDKNIDLQGTNPFGEKARAALTSPKASSAMVPPPSTSQEPS